MALISTGRCVSGGTLLAVACGSSVAVGVEEDTTRFDNEDTWSIDHSI